MDQLYCITEPKDVLLVNMPFAPLFRPSLMLSLLKPKLKSVNVSSKVLYFTIPFAEQIGTQLYGAISNGLPRPTDLVGEFIFSGALHGIPSKEYVKNVLAKSDSDETISEDFVEQILTVGNRADAFVDQCAAEALRYRPKILIFSNTAQQQIASLALAKRIKGYAPKTFIAFVGNNCHGVMGAELVRQFSFLDAVVSGECDIVIPEIVQRFLGRKSISNLKGVYTPNQIDSVFENGFFPIAEPVKEMDSLPYPDFDDFFDQHDESNIEKTAKKQLMFETSRGCWWGEKSHCTFCGLNNESMSYRSKSPQRALDELIHLTRRYPDCVISAIDNILHMKYFKDFIPRLAEQGLDLTIFYETKANLKKEQVRLLSEAGIKMIQPGVESFSTRVLSVMGKGVKALQNIQLLKWCKEYGVRPFWNILCGFSEEDPEDYYEMADLIPFLTHLPPPQSVGQIRIERFSPNYNNPEKFGFVNVKPYPAYFYLYPFPEEVVANLAYYFTYDYKTPRNVTEYVRPLRDQFVDWRKTYETSDLFSVDKGSHLQIWDLRPIAKNVFTVFRGVQQMLYLACDTITTIGELRKLVEQHFNETVTDQDVEALVKPMIDSGLIVCENHSYLSLAIPLGVYSPAKGVLKKFEATVKEMQSQNKSIPHSVVAKMSPSNREPFFYQRGTES